MITLNNISKHYYTKEGVVTALRHIHLHVNSGEIFGIIGKSGAGKSSLIRCVNLLEKPSEGQVFVAGHELTALPPEALRTARHKIGMIFQHFNLLYSRTVYDNIALPLELYGHTRHEIQSTIMPLLEFTDLLDKKNNYPAQLSGGQRQRVAIARALASQPKVLLSDEATSSLDPETTLTILELLKNIRNTLNLTILLITHEMSVIKNCCDRVGILQQGELIEENEVGEFFAHPKTEAAKKIISSSFVPSLPTLLTQHVLAFEQPDTHPVWRLWFLEKTATHPIISQLINQFNLHINILQANVEYIRNHPVGIMIIALDGDKNKLDASMQHLQQIGIQIEVLGYVPNDIIPLI